MSQIDLKDRFNYYIQITPDRGKGVAAAILVLAEVLQKEEVIGVEEK